MFINSNAQISPTSVGDTKLADWSALGFLQKLNSKNTWESMTYLGWASKNTEDYNPLAERYAWVLNEAITHKKSKQNWKYSVSLSYQRKTKYSHDEVGHETQSIKQEFRTYGLLNYTFKFHRLRIVPQIRQEIRNFYTSNFAHPKDDWELRSRFRLQFIYSLDQNNIHRIIGSSEQLFVTDHHHNSHDWSNFSYDDSRFMIFYSYSPPPLLLFLSSILKYIITL